MDWIERLQNSIKYVEKNLLEEMEIATIAKEANCSSFHFQRSFNIITGLTISEYIRRRRLTLAAEELMFGAPILETAVKYGYESQASFSRAYRKMHNISPGQTRSPGVKIKAFPPITFIFSIVGVSSMDYEIKSMEMFKIAGYSKGFTTKDEQNFTEIPKFWAEKGSTGQCKSLAQKAVDNGTLRNALLGVCMSSEEETENFDYLIAVSPKLDENLDGLSVIDIPAKTWAIFRGSGKMPEAIQDVWKRIYSEWFQAVNYEHDSGPEIEVYPQSDDKDDCPFEIWIPVRKK